MFQKKGPLRGESPKAQLLRQKKRNLKKEKHSFMVPFWLFFLGLLLDFFGYHFFGLNK
jgi:hypothetical protein